jgi:hypothetical protein
VIIFNLVTLKSPFNSVNQFIYDSNFRCFRFGSEKKLIEVMINEINSKNPKYPLNTLVCYESMENCQILIDLVEK